MSKNNFYLISGPCSAESLEQLDAVAREVRLAKHFYAMRAGVWKPRTSPGCFEGYGETALQWLAEIKKKYNIKIMVEVASAEHTALCIKYGIDILWIGARTTCSPFAVQEIADSLKDTPDIPVWVKNPISPDLALWIGAIDRLQHAGIKKVGAIHRGFRQYNFTPYRNAPMWEIMLELKQEKSDIPIICDPSHIAGERRYLKELCQTAINMETDGLMIEVHPCPDQALSDNSQQLTPEEFFKTYSSLIFRNDYTISNKIEQYRTVLDGLDNEILSQLSHRMKIVAEMGELKKRENISVLQFERWKKVVDCYCKQCEKLNLNKEFVDKILSVIHTESIRLQNKIFEDEDVHLLNKTNEDSNFK
ncbi:MAG: bifunctional 3-deoxy-7-phosphoheptulonate synthase/chorismate mutase type II [Bacteroidales bacterium]|jgi:chorismate mutase|nr:bifunctional 3-deoxy-7-phosphoheptulonate synthase/chorismate mutase type II [Bacteroidales bacterium]